MFPQHMFGLIARHTIIATMCCIAIDIKRLIANYFMYSQTLYVFPAADFLTRASRKASYGHEHSLLEIYIMIESASAPCRAQGALAPLALRVDETWVG